MALFFSLSHFAFARLLEDILSLSARYVTNRERRELEGSMVVINFVDSLNQYFEVWCDLYHVS